MLCGPSESLLIADATADPWRLALDLVNEAEHGTDSAALVVTDSVALASALEQAAAAAVASLPEPRRAYATAVLGNLGGVLLFDTMDDAVAFANEYAPEHCQIATADTEATLRSLRYADPCDAPDRRLRAAQRRGHGAHVPDDHLRRATLAGGSRRAGRPDDRAGRSRGLPGPRERVPGSRPRLSKRSCTDKPLLRPAGTADQAPFRAAEVALKDG
jgi:hypothetical protein